MAFRVRVTPAAPKDAKLILDWLLAQHAGKAELRWFRKMDEAIKSLAQFPERCRLAPESPSLPFGMGQLLYGEKLHAKR